MRTVGHHRPSWSPYGDTLSGCGHCGVAWHTSQMGRGRDGILYCPDCEGNDVVALDEANAKSSLPRARRDIPSSENYRISSANDETVYINNGDDL